MILGIALFGVVTATVTGLLLKPSGADTSGADPLDRIEQLHRLFQQGALIEDEYRAKTTEMLKRV